MHWISKDQNTQAITFLSIRSCCCSGQQKSMLRRVCLIDPFLACFKLPEYLLNRRLLEKWGTNKRTNWIGSVGSAWRSFFGTGSQRKWRLHQNPPTEEIRSPPEKAIVSADMWSITGHKTAVRFCLMRANNGSNLKSVVTVLAKLMLLCNIYLWKNVPSAYEKEANEKVFRNLISS